MFVSVSLVRMPPLNWGGDSDFFYRATYGPAIRGAEGIQRAVFGHVARITEERPRFTHGLMFWWDRRESWEAAKRRAAGMPPLPRAAQGLETYAGDLAQAGPLVADHGQGLIALWLFNSVAPGALAAYAAHVGATPGVRGVWIAEGVVVEGGDAPKPRSHVLIAEFENGETAARWLHPALPPSVRPLHEWAADVEIICFDSFEIPLAL